jgi:GR25 family glycosyltransferase involved in LPS biosynthesis
MKYSFINLESCADRREFVLNNFRSTSDDEQQIDRISAVDTEQIVKEGISGKLKPNEKACYFSHYKAIQSSLTHNDHVFIAEDDVVFCKQSTVVMNSMVDTIDEKSWDILYTDLCFPHIDSMVNLFFKRRQFETSNEMEFLNLSNLRFCGATAYIVNKASKQKILNFLPRNDLNFAIDIVLRQLIHHKKINGLALFPFPTSLSKYAENSQIQSGDDLVPDFLFNVYRRLVWLGRDINDVSALLNEVDNSLYDVDSDTFCALLRALLSTKIKTK